jgi:lysophospholipase L1-like esterase
MRIKGRPLWTIVSLTAVTSALIWMFGFGWAVSEITSSHRNSLQPSQIAREQKVSEQKNLFLTMGDSLTRGTGDTTGLGYAGRVRQRLQKQSSKLRFINLGVNGQTSHDLRRQLQRPRVQEFINQAGWVVITIGGNDLFRESGRLETIDAAKTRAAQQQYEKNLDAIFEMIREQNPDVPIFIFGLYNPFGDLKDSRITFRFVREWNDSIQEAAARHDRVVVIPTYDLFQLQPGKYLFNDHFHLNGDGYQLMAERLLQVMGDVDKDVTR